MPVLDDAYRSLFARARFRKLNERLFRLSLHGLGVLNFQNDRISGEQHFVRALLPGLVRARTPTFFDVGANEGNFTALLTAAFPQAVVHAFEPHPRNHARLATRAGSDGRVKCHAIALGEQPGTVTLYDRADSDGSSHASLHEAVISQIHKQGVVKVEVPIDTLDAVAAREAVSYIDYLKIDTEGHEMAVLQGGRRLLHEQRVGCIQFEFNEMNVASRVFLRDFRVLLAGYELFRLLPREMIVLGDSPLETELFAFQNIVAIKKAP